MLNLLKLVTYCTYVKKKIPICRKYTWKYLKIQGHDEQNLSSSGRERKEEEGGRGDSGRIKKWNRALSVSESE